VIRAQVSFRANGVSLACVEIFVANKGERDAMESVGAGLGGEVEEAPVIWRIQREVARLQGEF